MPDEEALRLIKRYCAPPEHRSKKFPGESAPLPNQPDEMENHRVEAFIDGNAYFDAIGVETRNLANSTAPGRFFYLTTWWLGLFSCAGGIRVTNPRILGGAWDFQPSGALDEFKMTDGTPLKRLLKGMVDAGVDVRVLPWFSPFVVYQEVEEASGIGNVNFHTLVSVRELRQLIGPGRVVINLLAHTLGAAHCKLVACGDQTGMRAYTSGLDPAPTRLTPTCTTVRDRYTYRPAPNVLDAVCDALDLGNLAVEFINGPLAYWYAWINQPGVQYQVDVFRANSEWQLVLEENTREHVITLRRTGDSLMMFEWELSGGGWHDIGVRVEGVAAGRIHNFITDMWNEQVGRSVETFQIDDDRIVSHDRSWSRLPTCQPAKLPADLGGQYLQVLRTVPLMNFTLGAKKRGELLVPESFEPRKYGIKNRYTKRIKIDRGTLRLPTGLLTSLVSDYERPRLDFARDGRFEFKVALKQAISAANSYIFIADQGMYCMEIMDWINLRMEQRPSVKVVLLHGRDPADPPENFLPEAINRHLLPGVVRRAPLLVDKQGEPRNVVFYEWGGNTVHCKVTIIDDVWCAIGSANCMQRSLYTDIELSVSILEPRTAEGLLPASPAEEAALPPQKKAPSFVQRFRRDLWAHYCGIPLAVELRSPRQLEQRTEFLDLDSALGIWDPLWGVPPAGLRLVDEIYKETLDPFPPSANPFSQKSYAMQDADSRQPF